MSARELLGEPAVGVQPRLAETLPKLIPVVPPGEGFGQQIEQIRIHAERFTHIANGTFRSVGDQSCG